MEKTEEGLLKLNREQALKLVQACKEDTTKKGVLLLGIPGTGKTTILEKVFGKSTDVFEISTIVKRNDGDIEEAIKTCTVERKNLSKTPAMNYFKTTGILIDDLGQEPLISLYGNNYDPVLNMIVHSYTSKYRFWATSNSDLKILTQRYGRRIVDRLKEMCYIVVLNDTNLRDNIKEDNNQIKNLLS